MRKFSPHFWLLLAFVIILCGPTTSLAARVMPPSRNPSSAAPGHKGWKIFSIQQVQEGVTVPADTNIIFHLPEKMSGITRENLLGGQGKEVRYWGYCFPETYNPQATRKGDLPGLLFLSEKEREIRAEAEKKGQPLFSTLRAPRRSQIEQITIVNSRYQHQKEIFEGGETCYLMTEKNLELGTDEDQDELNSGFERKHQTDPNRADTDGDGLYDGLEVLYHKTHPLDRDTDHDGLIDGLEVHQHRKQQAGDTNPLQPDSDRDGLCDGLCPMIRGLQICGQVGTEYACIDSTPTSWTGEDKNLNGIQDPGETSPLKADTDDDGITDLQELYDCFLRREEQC